MSAEFLKRARERLLKTADQATRIGSVASVALAPYTPFFSPQEKAQSAKDNGHTLIVDTPLNSSGIPKTFETPDGRRVVFNDTEREQVQSQEVSVLGLSARFDSQGRIVLSNPRGDEIDRIGNPDPGFNPKEGGIEISPDGRLVAGWTNQRPMFRVFTIPFIVNISTREERVVLPQMAGKPATGVQFQWASDSKKLAVTAPDASGASRDIFIVNPQSGELLLTLERVSNGVFSPDSQYYAGLKDKFLQVFSMDGRTVLSVDDVENFLWFPNSQALLVRGCSEWIGSSLPMCIGASKLSIIGFDGKKDNLGIESMRGTFPALSPDGQKILTISPSTRDFIVVNLETKRTTPLSVARTEGVARLDWDWMFYNERYILFYTTHITGKFIWVDALGGQVVARQRIDRKPDQGSRILEDARIVEIFKEHILYQVVETSTGKSRLYLWQINHEDNVVRGKEVVGGEPVPYSRGERVFGLIKEGQRIKVDEQNFLFLGGRKYLIEHEESTEYFGGQKGSIPEGLAWFIPEGEKISFQPGDVVGNKDGLWYLRGGKRWKVQNWDRFVERQRFNRGVWPLPSWIVEKILAGQVPEPIPGREGILDWDGKIKEYQPFGGRMIIFIGGYDGNTTSQLEAFQQIKARLIEKGWNERQFLEATYNVDINAPRRLVVPRAYFSRDTKVYPPQSFSKLRLQIQRYKEMFPMTKFILVGHSLGGFVAFEATTAHTDAIETVVTLDGSIEGIDKAFLIEVPELLDPVVSAVGDEVMGYMNALGDDPVRRQEQEDKALWLRGRKVRVFTFSNDDDWFVRNGVAVLSSSDAEFEGRPVRLIWKLGHFEPASVGDLLSGHEQILKEESFLEELARILPAS